MTMKNLILAAVFVVTACFLANEAVTFVKGITNKANVVMNGKR